MRRGPLPGDPLAARLFPPLPREVRWGLERTRRLLAALGEPLRTRPVLHVGGTNGKGTVARIWAEVLQASGLRVGLYTSPEFISFRERILIDGHPLPDAVLEARAEELRPLLVREGPSYFEAATVLAFLAMERADVDVAVVEVGMGGRLDATNVLEPLLTVITDVSLDHTALLGQTISEIAREKAGILKPGVPAFTAALDPIVLEALTREAATLGVPLTRVVQPRGAVSLEGIRIALRTRRWGRLELASPLVGRHQWANLALAVRSLDALPPRIPVSAGAVREGVARARPPGRFQVEREGERVWVLDNAHNTAAAAALATALEEAGAPRPRAGVAAILADKDHAGMLRALAPALDHVVLTAPAGVEPERRWDPDAASSAVSGAEIEPGPEAAFGRARELAGARGTVLVTGSSAIVADAMRALERVPAEALPPSGGFG